MGHIYLMFPNRYTLCSDLSWSHYRIGQMQMYVNYYTREMMNEGDMPPIGIVLCAEKNDAVVKIYTAGKQ